MSEFVQLVKVLGAEEAVRTLQALGVETANLGKATEDTGSKARDAKDPMEQLSASATDMIASYAGFAAVVKMFRDYIGYLEEAVQLQGEMADKAVTFADASKILARQTGRDEMGGARLLADLMIAGGLNESTAKAIGTQLSIERGRPGGKLEGEDVAIAREIAAIAGAVGMEGNEAAAFVKFLKSGGQLTSLEQVRKAGAQTIAAARSSNAFSIGAFVAGASKGGKGLFQFGVPFEEVLRLFAQSRQAEESEDLAAQTLVSIQQLALTGTYKAWDAQVRRRARELGMDPRNLTSADKIAASRSLLREIDTPAEESRFLKMSGAELGLRILKAMRGSTVEGTENVGEAIAGADGGDWLAEIERGKSELGFRARQNEAASKYEAYLSGREVFTLEQVRRRAEELRKSDQARGINRFGWTAESVREQYMLELMRQERDRLEREGADVSGLDAAIKAPSLLFGRQGRTLDPFVGYSDAYLQRIAGEISEVRRQQDLDRQAKFRQPIINNIGTVYQTTDPLIEPPPVQDLGD